MGARIYKGLVIALMCTLPSSSFAAVKKSFWKRCTWGINAGTSYTQGKFNQTVLGKQVQINGGYFGLPVIGGHLIFPKVTKGSRGKKKLWFSLASFLEFQTVHNEPDTVPVGISRGAIHAGEFHFFSWLIFGNIHFNKAYLGIGAGPGVSFDWGIYDLWTAISLGYNFNHRIFFDLRAQIDFFASNRFKQLPLFAQIGLNF